MESYVVEFLDYLRERKNRAANTLAAYEQDMYQFLRFLQSAGTDRLECITETNCRSYLLKLEREGKKPSSIARKLVVLRSFFDYCMRRGYVTEDPTERLSAARAEQTKPEILNAVQIRALLAAPDCMSVKGRRDRAMLELFYATGMQAMELSRIRVGDFNGKLGALRIEGEKKDRLVPVSKQAAQAVREYLMGRSEVKETDYLFPSRSGASLTRQAIWKIVRENGEKAGMSSVSPQTIRNTLTVQLLQNGAEASMMQELLGRSAMTTLTALPGKEISLWEGYQKTHPQCKGR